MTNKLSRQQTPQMQNQQSEYLVLGHLVKYNLYLLCKSVVFSSIVSKNSSEITTKEDVLKVVELTELALRELDLANKQN